MIGCHWYLHRKKSYLGFRSFDAAEKLLTKTPPFLEHKQEYEQLSLFII